MRKLTPVQRSVLGYFANATLRVDTGRRGKGLTAYRHEQGQTYGHRVNMNRIHRKALNTIHRRGLVKRDPYGDYKAVST